MKSSTRSTFPGHTSPDDAGYDGTIPFHTVIHDGIVIIDVMGL